MHMLVVACIAAIQVKLVTRGQQMAVACNVFQCVFIFKAFLVSMLSKTIHLKCRRIKQVDPVEEAGGG